MFEMLILISNFWTNRLKENSVIYIVLKQLWPISLHYENGNIKQHKLKIKHVYLG